jgi:hypothetical protein
LLHLFGLTQQRYGRTHMNSSPFVVARGQQLAVAA